MTIMATGDYGVLSTWCTTTAISISYSTQQPSQLTTLTDFWLVKQDPRLQDFPYGLRGARRTEENRSVCVCRC